MSSSIVIRKNVRENIVTKGYRSKGIFEDFKPIDQNRKNQLIDPFFMLTHEVKHWANKTLGEIVTKKIVRLDAIHELVRMEKPAGTQFSDVVGLSGNTKEELEETPYNVYYRYDGMWSGTLTALVTAFQTVESGQAKSSGSRQNTGSQVNEVPVTQIGGDTISSITQNLTKLIIDINDAPDFVSQCKDYGYEPVLKIVYPKSLVNSNFRARFPNAYNDDDIISVSTSNEEED
jgi:hypothetical protein